jgi:hypothetical protein
VAVRVRGAGRKQEVLARDELAARILDQVRTRTLQVGFEAPAADEASAGQAPAQEAAEN